MNRAYFIFILSLCLLLLASCGKKELENDPIEPFTFLNQYGNQFGTEELKGHLWLADFIFTNCQTVCQPMTMEMAKLQALFSEKDIAIQLVSFTVDPTVDTAEVLRQYIADYTDDTSNWHLLTGYSQSEIEQFAREQFHTIVQKPDSSTQVIHGTNFYLVDQKGRRVGEYNFIDPSYYETLIADIESLME